MQLPARLCVSPARMPPGVPFCYAGLQPGKHSRGKESRRFPVCRCDSLPHLGLRCGFKATAWALFFPRSTRGDTVRRESHRAVIDAM